MIEYKLIRSNRKTMSLCVTKEGAVEVHAPLRMPRLSIERFVTEKDAWIRKHVESQNRRLAEKRAFSLNFGDTILYRGTPHILTAQHSNTIRLGEGMFFLPGNLPDNLIKDACVQLYKHMAKQVLKQKVAEFALIMSLNYGSVKVNSAKTRWGSCSGKNNLNFSWRLIQAPDELIDYVVVHELSHICEHNHSARFWEVVASTMPDYKERIVKLKAFQISVEHENWE